MEDYLLRLWTDLIGRTSGPLTLRFILQPFMATLFAVRDGVNDARQDTAPFFWSLVIDPAARGGAIRHGWASVAKIFCLAIILDVLYQLIVFKWLYLFQTLIVAATLALLPYIVMRGPANRIARLWLQKREARRC